MRSSFGWLAPVLGLLLWAAACGKVEGDLCTEDKNCGGSYICAQIVAGGPGRGTCQKSCETDDDCGRMENCVADRAGRLACQDSTTEP